MRCLDVESMDKINQLSKKALKFNYVSSIIDEMIHNVQDDGCNPVMELRVGDRKIGLSKKEAGVIVFLLLGAKSDAEIKINEAEREIVNITNKVGIKMDQPLEEKVE